MIYTFEKLSQEWIEKFYSEENPHEHFLTLPQISDVLGVALLSLIKNKTKEFKVKQRKSTDIKEHNPQPTNTTPQVNILELGAGDGELALQLLSHSEKFGLQIKRYVCIEGSAKRRKKIKGKLKEFEEKVAILSSLEELKPEETKFEKPKSGNSAAFQSKFLVIANEFFDSLPFSITKAVRENSKTEIKELYLKISSLKDGKPEIKEAFFDTLSPETKSFIEKYLAELVEEYIIRKSEELYFEVSPESERVLKELSENLHLEYIIICDYGYPNFLLRPLSGTIILHRKFQAEKLSPDDKNFEEKLNLSFGKKDISFLVDFPVLKKIVEELGLSFRISPLHKFVFENLFEEKNISEKILFSGEMKHQNILSFSDVMAGWGNFFVALIEKKQE